MDAKYYADTCQDGQGRRCTRPAKVRLCAPNGTLVPGKGMCLEHAREVVEEYKEKLEEAWTVKPIGETS